MNVPSSPTSRHFRQMASLIVLLPCGFMAGCAFGAAAPPSMPNSKMSTGTEKVSSQQTAIDIADVKNIGGFVGQRMTANRENNLKKFDINLYTKMVEDQKARDWWWIGEQPGKWIESATWSSREASDAGLEAQTRAILARIEAAQKPDGYVGITDTAVRTAAQPLRGMDPYELYFMLHGLITASQELNDPKALDAAKKLGDYFANTIGPGKAEFWPSDKRPPQNIKARLDGHSQVAGHSVHYGFEGTLLIDPMLRLYQVTGDKKYLDWSQWVVANMDKWSGWDTFSRLDDVAAGKIGLNDLQPYVHTHTFQMNFLGLLRLYQITGDASLLRKVEGAWNDATKRQMYITGGVSVGEHYEVGNYKPIEGNVVETCANMSWMQLNQALLELTGDTKYADTMEKLLVNHVFASQTEDGDSYRYHTPPNGQKPIEYYHGPDCCTSSGHRLVSMLPEFFYGQKGNSIYVNQFVPSTGDFKLADGSQVSITQQTSYPETDKVTLLVAPQKTGQFALNVRIPSWCAAPSLKLNGKAVAAKAGSYASLDRTWKSGDKIELALPMATRWVQSDGGEKREGAPANDRLWALERGPVVYAVDTVWWDKVKAKMPSNIGQEAGVTVDTKAAYAVNPAPAGAIGPALSVPITLVNGEKVVAPMLPFSNVGTWYRKGEAKPAHNAAAYSYAVWLPSVESPSFENAKKQSLALREQIANSTDYIEIGNAESERTHNLSGQSGAGVAFGRNWRDSRGTFSFDVKVLTEGPSTLVTTYWGGDNGRSFDILANDRVIGSVNLTNSKPGQFIDVRSTIPFDLVQGKTDNLGQKVDHVTIKFVAKEGTIAGGLFGLRVEKGAAN